MMTLLLQATGNSYESRIAGNRIQPRTIQPRAGALETPLDPTLSTLDDTERGC